MIATKGGAAAFPTGDPSASEPTARPACADSGSTPSTSGSCTRPIPRSPSRSSSAPSASFATGGKIRFVGVSNVSLGELFQAVELIEIATVQNRFNLAEQEADSVPRACEERKIGFMPFAPIAMGGLVRSCGALAGVAARQGATEAQVALAWLLRRSPVVLPIPGTGSVEHLRENVDAA